MAARKEVYGVDEVVAEGWSNAPAGAMVVIAGLRALVCPCAREMAFNGEAISGTARSLQRFLKSVDEGARRRLYLAPALALQATADEQALVNLIAEAQIGADAAARARALWLVKRTRIEAVLERANDVAASLLEDGIVLSPNRAAAGVFSPLRVINECGAALVC